MWVHLCVSHTEKYISMLSHPCRDEKLLDRFWLKWWKNNLKDNTKKQDHSRRYQYIQSFDKSFVWNMSYFESTQIGIFAIFTENDAPNQQNNITYANSRSILGDIGTLLAWSFWLTMLRWNRGCLYVCMHECMYICVYVCV